MDNLESHLRYYRSQHRTLGCKITHMFGIPMIAVSIPLLFFSWPTSVGLFVVGWALQFIGHFVFEHNSPVLFSDPKDPMTYIVALVFCADEWKNLFTGKLLSAAE
jgi:uncharacterized membrane protein YGL010W